MKVGVLALQGDHAAHRLALEAAAGGREVSVLPIRRPEQLSELSGLALPGGESTTMLRLLALEGLDHAIREAAGQGLALLGTCAGAILLAREVRSPEQDSLGLLDAVAERNSYGRQAESRIAALSLMRDESGQPLIGGEPTMEGVFIRAPRLMELGAEVEVLAKRGEDPVLVRQGRVLAATFHPELGEDLRLQQLFLDLAASD